jgi:hypothetical protein
MTLKSLLFGSAAVLAVGTGAQAADLPIAEPVEYVRICDAFGAGFYFIPGTDTCLKVGGQVRAEFHWVDTLDGNGDLLGADDPELNNFTSRARGNVRLDARTQTDFGLIRAFIDLEMTVGPGGLVESSNTTFDINPSSSFGNANYSSTGANLAAAFVQISNDMGTFTAGHTGSFFDFFGSFNFGTRLDTDDSTTEQTLFAYTFSGGNGFSATLSLEDPASSGRRLNPGVFVVEFDPLDPPVVFPFPGDYEGQEAPDLVANIRIDQGWGAAQLSGVVGQIHDNDPAGEGGEFDGEDGEDQIGWAVSGGLSTTIPVLGGLEFGVQAGYSEGRIGYITTDRGGLGDFIDGPGDDDLEANEAWMVRAGVRAGITETVDASVSGSFTHVEQGDLDNDGVGDGVRVVDDLEYDFWAVNANLRWKPVEGLYMGPEVAYQTIDRQGSPAYGDGDEDENDVIGVMFRLQRSF